MGRAPTAALDSRSELGELATDPEPWCGEAVRLMGEPLKNPSLGYGAEVTSRCGQISSRVGANTSSRIGSSGGPP